MTAQDASQQAFMQAWLAGVHQAGGDPAASGLGMHPGSSSSTTSAPESSLMHQNAAAVQSTAAQAITDGGAFDSLRQDAPPATSMDEEDTSDSARGDEETESSSSRSTVSIFDRYDEDDDQDAPASVLLASRDVRRFIHANTKGGNGLIIHRFHIRRRGGKDRKPGATHAHAGWGVECDVCGNGKLQALDSPESSHHALYTFQKDHLKGQTHLRKGTDLLAAAALAGKNAMLDGDAAAADSRVAIENQTLPPSTNDSSRRRDTTPIDPMGLIASSLELLVGENDALEWQEVEASSSSPTLSCVKCVYCDFTSTATAGEPALLLSELTEHLKSQRHKHLRAHRGGLKQLFAPAHGPAPPPPPDLTRLCWGFYDDELEVNGKMCKTSVLMNYDTSKLDWHPEPFMKATFVSSVDGSNITINGTYRSEMCARFCTTTTGARLPYLRCFACSGIKTKKSYRNALQRRHAGGKDAAKTNFQVRRGTPTNTNSNHFSACHPPVLTTVPAPIREQFLPHPELVILLRERTKMIDVLERKLWLLRRNYNRQSHRLRSLRAELGEKASRGDAEGVAATIISAVRSGKEKLKPALLSFVCDLLKSASMWDDQTGHGSKGVRWKETSKQILAVIQKKGKGSLVRFFRSTLDGASDETIRRQWVKDRVKLIMGESTQNFEEVALIYIGLMNKLGITGPVPYELQEDETHINGKLSYDQANDKPVGTCGMCSPTHKCDANHDHTPLGSGEAAYDAIVHFALHEQRAFYLRVVTIAPLHPSLPALPVVIHPTCQRFDCAWILGSWGRMESFCKSTLASSLGPVPQGHGSDGNAALFAAMKSRMHHPPRAGRFSLAAPGLLITGTLTAIGGTEYVSDLHMQDPRHCLSLLFGNGADNDGKDTMMGDHAVSIADHRATAKLAEAHGTSTELSSVSWIAAMRRARRGRRS